ncbi:hypothetical protein ARMGADRAFT_1017700 [Armillaria gallica]|uniref:Uncharacterized protein n=1 Tax=Armillaria gallica TaxID=47427 RepID=A0A2H3D982_ARMGA|nr:hypothetical protein ARMGADRAFT_1017700 [Armillaria gallica]
MSCHQSTDDTATPAQLFRALHFFDYDNECIYLSGSLPSAVLPYLFYIRQRLDVLSSKVPL